MTRSRLPRRWTRRLTTSCGRAWKRFAEQLSRGTPGPPPQRGWLSHDQLTYWQTYRSGQPSPSRSAQAALVAQKCWPRAPAALPPSPAACVALDGGVGTQSAAVNAFGMYQALAATHDLRGEAGPSMPSYYGTAQGIASNAANHVALYCDANDQAAGLCSSGQSNPKADADQRFSSLFGSGTYSDQPSVVAAKDYAINLIEPAAPGALRGDQLASIAGQDAAMRRRSYNARMSLAQSFVDQAIALQTSSVPLTATQQQYLSNLGLPAQQNGSLYQVMQIEAERRISDVSWASWMQSAPPASVEREIAIELAQTNYLLWQTFKVAMQTGTISATQLAQTAERDFMPTVRMPAPTMTSAN